jgi:hypothetical protein
MRKEKKTDKISANSFAGKKLLKYFRLQSARKETLREPHQVA